ncbi:hypothetical protein LTR10_014583 [Elasticomyces elasticus]|uniref:Uncharacterized protein n=1 Tax=Exophiala sideris TaxID=1016849 RepID=A0ABR0JTB2_9EURO|nr:hypothetical protein LTR10_014583 [Elasticomyces elasticus]KAK5040562.1 hypothetical protein LTS07_001060 [Exophiala sideris]KAK5043014.1 hypothetical protein LTR13_000785 [Exophiala sideris]KAK5068940.1 hypothetical protein LTR69_001061 [Exophiala sideris]KAK5186536.1 hypothetical protein LTR44_001592 [Eurotiomycetes sp. CCFEE 6388]
MYATRPSSRLNKVAPFNYVLLLIFACLFLLYFKSIYHPTSVPLVGASRKNVAEYHRPNNQDFPIDVPQANDDQSIETGGSDDDSDSTDSDGSHHDEFDPGPEYRQVYSLTTPDRKFFPISFVDILAYNPNILPNPIKQDQWIIIAQQEMSRIEKTVLNELTCTAEFVDNALVCTAPPTVLPVQPSVQGICETEQLNMFNFLHGPRDARMFYGPDAPYIMYGSQSNHGCMGLWVQDARMLIPDFQPDYSDSTQPFYDVTEVGRPPPRHGVEKNFFLFWDGQSEAYAHHELHVERVFARLFMSDGTVGPDLAPQVANEDNLCLARYLPKIEPGAPESIHQATNSLAITLCKRADDECVPTDDNTFVMTIVQHKTYYGYHAVYEPYVVLFQRTAPFALHAISTKPIWIHGRGRLTRETHAVFYEDRPDGEIPQDHTEMFYVTSMSWKSHDQRYHGFIDDPLFLAFGIEDTRSGAIDILSGDLLQDLGSCKT